MSERSNGTISFEELLGFYSEAGVDTPLDDTPIDRFKQSAEIIKQVTASARETTVPQERENARPAPRHAPPQRISVEGQVATAHELARNAKNLDELFEALKSFNGCTLKLTAKNTCFADGTPHSKLMLVGEAPGRETVLSAPEDNGSRITWKTAKPFRLCQHFIRPIYCERRARRNSPGQIFWKSAMRLTSSVRHTGFTINGVYETVHDGVYGFSR